MNLYDKMLKLQQDSNSVTNSPILLSFTLENLKLIDVYAENDDFIKSKKKAILNNIINIKDYYDEKLKTAFDEYSECMTYINLKKKNIDVDRISEQESSKTPDFKISYINEYQETEEIYAELKTLAFSSGSLNYTEAMNKTFNAKVKQEDEILEGKSIASTGFINIAPLKNTNKDYDPFSTKYLINELTDKVDQNIKPEQYNLGPTVLIVDLKQIDVISQGYKQTAVPVYEEKHLGSLVSGALWNVAFGKEKHPVYNPIEFEGRPNSEGELGVEGILNKYEFIDAIVFHKYELGDAEPKIIGLKRYKNTPESICKFLFEYCDFVNDDENSSGFAYYKPV